jgi:hypothetical protein
VTLALVRPLFLVVAYAPGSTPRLAIASAAVGLCAAAGALVLAPALAIASGLGMVFGVSLALVGIALAAALEPRWDAPERPTRQGPHWQAILLHLRGSSGHVQGPGRPEWTQEEIARRLGIPRPRVSEFPERANRSAQARAQGGGRPAPLVRVHRGAVASRPGTWTYYTLTPEGESVAAEIASQAAA